MCKAFSQQMNVVECFFFPIIIVIVIGLAANYVLSKHRISAEPVPIIIFGQENMER